MEINEFLKLAEVLAWPVVAVLGIVLVASPLTKLLDALASSLRLKNVKIKVFGVEVELSPEEVKAAVNDLLQEISDATNGLDDEEIKLFEKIISSNGSSTVLQLDDKFVRAEGNAAWKRLGRLRDRQLAKPREPGRWQGDKHPIPTRFGSLVYSIRKRNLVPGAPLTAPGSQTTLLRNQ